MVNLSVTKHACFVFKASAVLFPLLTLQTLANGVSGHNATGLLMQTDEFLSFSDNYAFDMKVVGSNQQYDLKVRVRDRTKGLVKIVKPTNFAGEGFLFLNHVVWHHSTEIGQSLMRPSRYQFLNGIDNFDLISTSFSANYKVIDTVIGSDVIKIELQSHENSVRYPRVVVYVEHNSYRPIEAKYFLDAKSQNKTDHPKKTIVFEEFRKILGKERLVEFRIIDHVNNERETLLNYSALRNTDSPEAWFTPSYLERFK